MHQSFDDPDFDATIRAVARFLAPYVAEELNRPQVRLSPAYDGTTCEIFLRELSSEVLLRAIRFFHGLQRFEKVSSPDLASALETSTPRNIPGLLTTHLKRRARQLNLPLPFEGGQGARPFGGIPNPDPKQDDPLRTYWQDRDGIAERMVEAARQELAQRGTPYPN